MYILYIIHKYCQEFQSIGLSSICTHSAAVDSRHVITSLVNAAYSLLQRFRRCIRSRDELQERWHILSTLP